MTLWSLQRSPLMMGGELTKCDDFTRSLLTHGEVLSIQRESYCAHPLWTNDDEAAWIAPRKDGRGLDAAVFNLSDAVRTVSIADAQIERPVTRAVELWTGSAAAQLSAGLAPHACAVWLVEG